MDRGAWRAAVRGVAESDAAELLTQGTHCPESNLGQGCGRVGSVTGSWWLGPLPGGWTSPKEAEKGGLHWAGKDGQSGLHR